MLPKLPVGTANEQRPSRADGGDVVDDLGHHPGPVDRVHGRQPHPVAEGDVGEAAPSPGPGSRRRCPRRRRCGRWARRPWSSAGAARRSPGRRGGARRCRACRGRRRPRWRPSRCRPRWPPTIVARLARARVSSWSNRRPTSCRATSLKASVGPRNSSSRCSVAELDDRAHVGVVEGGVGLGDDGARSRRARSSPRRTATSRRRRRRRRAAARPSPASSVGHVVGHVEAAVAAPGRRGARRRSRAPGAAPRVETYVSISSSSPTTRSDRADAVDRVELARGRAGWPARRPRGRGG